MQFPEGDTLGVVFSFLTTFQLLQKRMFIVCKEWKRVMCNLPHAWGDTLYLCSMHVPADWTRFAWNRITGLNMPRTTTNQGLLGLSVMPLKDLCLDHCRRITDIGLTYLSTLSITELSLKYTDVTDIGLRQLKRSQKMFGNKTKQNRRAYLSEQIPNACMNTFRAHSERMHENIPNAFRTHSERIPSIRSEDVRKTFVRRSEDVPKTEDASEK